MWRHQAGRIDFDGPLLRLWRRGWAFREYAPIVGARDGGHWSVVGVHGGARVRGDHPGRREAWAEAVRLALRAAVGRRPLLAAPFSGTVGPADIRPDPLDFRPAGIGTAIDRAPSTVRNTARGPDVARRPRGQPQHE